MNGPVSRGTPDYLTLIQQSAALQARQKLFGIQPGGFGSGAPEMKERVRSPYTGKAAPESVEEAEGGTPAHQARDKERKKER